ncbi:hypothetical protein CPT03_02250 [Pedobacter ginsengisoli]|uniref:Uncharacterized protein n=1 Tax=Pedobacter ginsengisoli TaxID=363852 RepID=A0A2D1U192_9SPHI|nr:hypothetical protein [Pedobacter ginsengisoli]ATP55367.1 hypothetical protein CPT03_02250 [Pedobacter ginsengisoli]
MNKTLKNESKEFLIDQTLNLLTNNYIYKDIPNKIQGCHYLFMVSKVIDSNLFSNLSLDLLLESLKEAYSEAKLTTTKKKEGLILMVIYIICSSEEEGFCIDIKALYQALNEDFEDLLECDISLSTLYLTLYIGIYSGTPNKIFYERVSKTLENFYPRKAELINIVLFSISLFFYRKVYKDKASNHFERALSEIESLFLIEENTESKILLLCSLWFMRGYATDQLLFDNEIMIKIERLMNMEKLSHSENAYLIKFLYFALNNETNVDQDDLMNYTEAFDDFRLGILAVSKNEFHRFKVGEVILNILTTVVYEEYK